MIDHLSFYATDFEKTKRFYDEALAALGYKRTMELTASWNPSWPTQKMCAYGEEYEACLWVIEAKDKASPRHVAFRAKNRAAVDAFHAAGLKAGAADNGAPGERPHYHKGYYGAFLIDPDGNNVEAVVHNE